MIVRWTTIFALYKLGVASHLLAALYPPHGPKVTEPRAAALYPEGRAAIEAPPARERSASG